MNKEKIIIVLVFAVVAGGVGIIASREWSPPNLGQSITIPVVSAGKNPPREAPEGFLLYENEQFDFSLFYPAELGVSERDEEGDAQTILFQTPSGGFGFQIFIVPYDKKEITEERFKNDVPSGVRKEPVTVWVDGVQGVAFWSENAALGETREVWFIHDWYLYEVTTYKELDEWLMNILSSWAFT